MNEDKRQASDVTQKIINHNTHDWIVECGVLVWSSTMRETVCPQLHFWNTSLRTTNTGWLTSWPADWLTGWLADQLTGCYTVFTGCAKNHIFHLNEYFSLESKYLIVFQSDLVQLTQRQMASSSSSSSLPSPCPCPFLSLPLLYSTIKEGGKTKTTFG